MVKVLSLADDDGDYFYGETEDKGQGIFPAHVIEKVNKAPVVTVEETTKADSSVSREQGAHADANEPPSDAIEDIPTKSAPTSQELSDNIATEAPAVQPPPSSTTKASDNRPPPPTKFVTCFRNI